jgi:hypothetical protein
LRGRDWDIETSSDNDAHDVAKLHREAPARTVKADAISEVAHHAILGILAEYRWKVEGKTYAIGPETDYHCCGCIASALN